MSLGAGIGLFVIGAILAFAVNVQLDWVDLSVVGYILMAAGVVGIVFGIVFITRRARSETTQRSAIDPATGERVSRTVSDHDAPLL
ncbi:MAG: hypothetical protein J7480_06995 [Microbacteriaceae bacterium]|nr:hypothetical protein [Microbacteriaceae bacterium]